VEQQLVLEHSHSGAIVTPFQLTYFNPPGEQKMIVTNPSGNGVQAIG